MNRLVPRLMLIAVFSASAALANAQAVSRGGGGGSSSHSSGGGSSGGGSSGGGSSSGGSSSGGGTSHSYGGGGGGGSTSSAPSHSAAPARTPSHTGGGSYASGGSSGGSYAGSAGTRRPDGGSTSAATAPTYSRPSSSGIVGYAVPRAPGSYRPIYNSPPIYFFNPWFMGSFGYGYGLSYFYDPFYGPLGYGYGYPGMGYYGYGYPSGYDYGYDTWYSYNRSEPRTGQLRIKVKPTEAKVLVDGAFVGTVEDFNGLFHKLTLPEGRHQIVLQLDGYDTLSFDVMIVAGETVNYKGEMRKLTR